MQEKMNKGNLSIMIVDDHKLFRDGLMLLLGSYYPSSIILESANGREYLHAIKESVPDITLMDINMPEVDGIQATENATRTHPDIRIIALSMHGDEAYYHKMIDAGVKGFLMKDSEIQEVCEAIDAVLEGGHYFSKELLYNIVKNIRSNKADADQDIILSERETEILRLICLGHSNQEISNKLFISKRTVDKHRANILSKTNSRNTAHLVLNAIRNRWVEV
jgi:DNA-binding NarL/FixJ family response regulator